MELIFTANSPGEVATWLAPTLRAVKERAADAWTTVFLVPCAFATGAEVDVVRAMPEADRAFGPGDYWRVALGWRRFEWAHGRRPSRAALLYLGRRPGARRGACPAAAGARRWPTWSGAAAGAGRSGKCSCPTRGPGTACCGRGEADQSVAVVGDLMVDAVRPPRARAGSAAAWGLDPEKPIVAVFPGSRRYEIELTLPVFPAGRGTLAGRPPGRAVRHQLVRLRVPRLLHGSRRGRAGRHLGDGGGRGRPLAVTTERGCRPSPCKDGLTTSWRAADMALTVPGSNTAEMAAVGLPMVVRLPMNLAEKIPLPGAAQYVEQLPVVGKRLKRSLVLQAGRGHALCRLAQPQSRPDDGARSAGHPAAGGCGAGGGAAVGRREAPRGHEPAAAGSHGPGGAAGRVAERLLQAAAAG